MANIFADKSVIVTGAGAGMGKQIAKDFIDEGATVLGVDINEKALTEVKSELGDNFITFLGDVSRPETIENAISYLVQKTGKLDILVNNAGVAGHSEPIGETSDADWDRIISINLSGPMYAIRAAVNRMLQQEGGGNIVTIASLAAIRGCRSCASYGAAKHGLIGLCENTAYMYLHKKIRSNIVCPGAIKTGMTSHPELENQFGRERIRSGMDPDLVYGTPEDVSNAVLFLAKDESKFINGATLVVDGGISCN